MDDPEQHPSAQVRVLVFEALVPQHSVLGQAPQFPQGLHPVQALTHTSESVVGPVQQASLQVRVRVLEASVPQHSELGQALHGVQSFQPDFGI